MLGGVPFLRLALLMRVPSLFLKVDGQQFRFLRWELLYVLVGPVKFAVTGQPEGETVGGKMRIRRTTGQEGSPE